MNKKICFVFLIICPVVLLEGCNFSIIEPAYTDIEIIDNLEIAQDYSKNDEDILEQKESSFEDYLDVSTENKDIDSEEDTKVSIVETNIELDAEHIKKQYLINSKLDLTGLCVFLIYNNGEKKYLSAEDYEISEVDMSTYGIKEVIVTYGDFSRSFYVEVIFIVTDVEPKTMYSTTSLNIRKGPSTDFEKISCLEVNDEVKITGTCDNGWSRVDYNGEEAYVSTKYLSDKKVETSQTTYNTDMSGLVFDGEVSQECRNKAIELYSKVPQNVKNAIINSGYQVVVSTNPSWTDGHAGIYYPFGWDGWQGKSIAIYAGSVGKVKLAFIHEIGHFIDNYVGRRDGYDYSYRFDYQAVTSTEEWQEIYTSEAGASGFAGWVVDCCEDYFAEVISRALVNPTWCQNTIPRSYEYVMRYINAC